MDCLFCQIVSKKVDSDIIYEDDEIIAFSDINPKTPIHKLIVPRKHIATINDLSADDTLLVGNMIQTARQLAGELNIADAGYRLVLNTNHDGGQIVYHIHLHLLGGRDLTWPPG
ncbi:MAG: histidine triad nucleotide-binding protein [Gammaproteobacteria bacterium]